MKLNPVNAGSPKQQQDLTIEEEWRRERFEAAVHGMANGVSSAEARSARVLIGRRGERDVSESALSQHSGRRVSPRWVTLPGQTQSKRNAAAVVCSFTIPSAGLKVSCFYLLCLRAL